MEAKMAQIYASLAQTNPKKTAILILIVFGTAPGLVSLPGNLVWHRAWPGQDQNGRLFWIRLGKAWYNLRDSRGDFRDPREDPRDPREDPRDLRENPWDPSVPGTPV